MIKKLESGGYRLYPRKKDPKPEGGEISERSSFRSGKETRESCSSSISDGTPGEQRVTDEKPVDPGDKDAQRS
jgi:hypothetical protein